MSTRSIIARTGEQEGQFAGRYVHADGMPTSMGAALWSLLHGHFQNDLHKMLAYLIDAPHAVAGWSAPAPATPAATAARPPAAASNRESRPGLT